MAFLSDVVAGPELKCRQEVYRLKARWATDAHLKVKVKSLSRVRLCDPVDCSLPGSSVQGILEARILEWVAISFSRHTLALS